MNLNKFKFVSSVLKYKNTYRLLIGMFLLLFTQVAIPNMHHHSEGHEKQGIHISTDEECIICALHIVAAEFVVPILFSILFFSILLVSIETIITPILRIFYPLVRGRAPPVGA